MNNNNNNNNNNKTVLFYYLSRSQFCKEPLTNYYKV